jgi:hypothetical protein
MRIKCTREKVERGTASFKNAADSKQKNKAFLKEH